MKPLATINHIQEMHFQIHNLNGAMEIANGTNQNKIKAIQMETIMEAHQAKTAK